MSFQSSIYESVHRTLCCSIWWWISLSRRLRLRSSSVSSGAALPPALISARFRFPMVSSARRAWRSAGVSVQSVETVDFSSVVRENCLDLSFVGSSAMRRHEKISAAIVPGHTFQKTRVLRGSQHPFVPLESFRLQRVLQPFSVSWAH